MGCWVTLPWWGKHIYLGGAGWAGGFIKHLEVKTKTFQPNNVIEILKYFETSTVRSI